MINKYFKRYMQFKYLKWVMLFVLGNLAGSLILLGANKLNKQAKSCYLQQIGEKSVSALNLKSNDFIVIYINHNDEGYFITIKHSYDNYEDFYICFDIKKFIYYLEKNSIPYQVVDKTRSRKCKNSLY